MNTLEYYRVFSPPKKKLNQIITNNRKIGIVTPFGKGYTATASTLRIINVERKEKLPKYVPIMTL